jgi:hypothetical protein
VNYEGTDIIAANAAIVGSLCGTTPKLCNYDETNRDCGSTGQYVLTAGDIINFTFGLGGWQDVFYSAILGPTKS